jgi:hypothetical protein
MPIFLNYGQFADTSWLWRHQGTGGYCSKRFVTDSLQSALEKHEGTSFQTGSHTRWYKDYLDNGQAGISGAAEAHVLTTDGETLTTLFQAFVGITFDSLGTLNNAAVNATNPLPCVLNFM